MTKKFANDAEFDDYIEAMCDRLGGWEIINGVPYDENLDTVSEYCTRFPNSWKEIRVTLECACRDRDIDISDLQEA